MKGFLVLWFSLLGLMGWFTLGCIGQARADTPVNDFLNDVRALGFLSDDGDSGLIRNGLAVCAYIADGNNGLQAAEMVYNSTGLDVNAYDAANFVIASVTNLCPIFDNSGAPA